jgi:hypothetical protein
MVAEIIILDYIAPYLEDNGKRKWHHLNGAVSLPPPGLEMQSFAASCKNYQA